jgi:hypothetical protein
MKKVLFTLLAAGFMAIVACGPGAEEKAAAEKAAKDSIEALNAIQEASQEANMMQDSANMMVDTSANKMSGESK